jgi:UDP-N-acetyl-2-amino-2-deoxyglucuronate dehydrogenase
MVVNPWNIDGLIQIERETGKKVNSILQLRLHPSIISLREKVVSKPNDLKYDVDLSYITSRGHWYKQSWKGEEKKSGGIAANIGVHFFDMLHYLFGALQNNVVHLLNETVASGYLEYERARVRWFLSVDARDLPEEQRAAGQRTYRSITIGGEEIEFSDGFTDLHIRSYEEILAGRGFGLEENRTAINTVAAIRGETVFTGRGDYHPLLKARKAS